MSTHQIGALNGLRLLRGRADTARILLNRICVHTRRTDHGLSSKLQTGVRVRVFVMTAISLV